jgi:hypothetical protein
MRKPNRTTQWDRKKTRSLWFWQTQMLKSNALETSRTTLIEKHSLDFASKKSSMEFWELLRGNEVGR